MLLSRLACALLVATSCLEPIDLSKHRFQCVRDAECDGGRCDEGRGVCVPRQDAGSNDAPFVALQAGFFCSEGWCWESPFPHGVDLNAVFAEGDDLVVAGNHGMLAERRDGGWTSLQSLAPPDRFWSDLWGTSFTDVWLAGDFRPFHRTSTGWAPLGSALNWTTRSVTGSGSAVFFAAGREVIERDGDGWSTRASVTDGDLIDLTFAFGALYGLVSTTYPAGAVFRVSTGERWSFDAGAYETIFGTADRLFVSGERSVVLDQTLQPRGLSNAFTTGVATSTQVFGASPIAVGLIVDGGLRVETAVVGVRAMAVGARAVAVGEGGLVLERRGTSWVDPTPTVTRSEVRAFVQLQGAVVAITEDCELLERGTATWASRQLLPERCTDAVADGDFLVVLTTNGAVVTFDSAFRQTAREDVGRGVEARRLWRSEWGLVFTTATEVFARRSGSTFVAVPGLAGAWGVSGRGSVARVCGLPEGAVAEFDLGQDPPVVVNTGLRAENCRAVTALRDGGWALGARSGSTPEVRLIAANGTSRVVVVDYTAAAIEALLETPGGVAVAVDGVAFVPWASRPTRVEPSRRFSTPLRALATWRSRLLVGGTGGAILQSAAP